MQPSTWALVPLKSSERAKSRLAGTLDAEQRQRLFFAMARRVILALRESRNIDAVAVVTSSLEVRAFAESLNALPVVQQEDAGMSPAIEAALRILNGMHPERVLIVAGDLPLVCASAVDEIFTGQVCREHVVVVPDRHRDGTNALLCSPPQAIAPCFGSSSFRRHLAAARAANLATRVAEIERLALDLDCADDLEHLRSRPGAQPWGLSMSSGPAGDTFSGAAPRG